MGEMWWRIVKHPQALRYPPSKIDSTSRGIWTPIGSGAASRFTAAVGCYEKGNEDGEVP